MFSFPWKFVPVLPVFAVLASCGGGGSVNDGTGELTLKPSTVKVSSSVQGCPGYAQGLNVMVTGGDGPYIIFNPIPQSIALSTTRVAKGGESFRIDVLGGCLDSVPLTVTDSDGNTADFVVSRVYVKPDQE